MQLTVLVVSKMTDEVYNTSLFLANENVQELFTIQMYFIIFIQY